MFFENKDRQKLILVISNIIFILLSAFQFFYHQEGQSVNMISSSNEVITVYITKEGNSSSDSNNNGKININTATATELEKLNGIGEVKAKAIIKYREEHGPFTNITQVLKVYGIGDATYDKIKDDICV